MFSVLPPPPRNANGTLATGSTPITLETNNLLAHPSGLDLVVGEGSYILRDDLLLATPPPHPSDATQVNTNPLAPVTALEQTGTKLSTVVIASSGDAGKHGFLQALNARMPIASIQEEVASPKSESGSINGFGSTSYYHSVPSFGEGNPALVPAVNVKGKKKEEKSKPKSNIIKSNSSFVSRVTPHESMVKRLSERSPDGPLAFANVNRSLFFLDLANKETKVEHLTKVLFTKAHPLCHDVNFTTKASNHLDIIIGFNTSDIIWYEPMTQKYTRLNKNGAVNATPVIDIKWLPGKENLFLAAHADGALIVYDKEKEDAEFVPEEEENPLAEDTTSHMPAVKGQLEITKSVQSHNQKNNPVAYWRVGKSKVNKFAFSPSGEHLAVVSENGTLTVLDYINERILDVYCSFYGALLAVTWSPDGHYILTGGQDDLISIWSFAEQSLVARCVGHESWVRDIKFDVWRCDERNYRFGSVGEDCRLLLWDFSVGMLGRPKAMSIRNRGSISSAVGQGRKESVVTVGRLRSNSNLTQQNDEEQQIIHAVDGKAATSILPPVMSKIVDDHPLRCLVFAEHSILTSCDNAHIREWNRPKETVAESSPSKTDSVGATL